MTTKPRPTVDSANLIAWREKRNWFQRTAAETLGVSYRAYQSYEAGRCPKIVWMAAKYYDLTHKRVNAPPLASNTHMKVKMVDG